MGPGTEIPKRKMGKGSQTGIDIIHRTPIWTEWTTDRCKNITLPQTSFAGGKYLNHHPLLDETSGEHFVVNWGFMTFGDLWLYSPLSQCFTLQVAPLFCAGPTNKECLPTCVLRLSCPQPTKLNESTRLKTKYEMFKAYVTQLVDVTEQLSDTS